MQMFLALLGAGVAFIIFRVISSILDDRRMAAEARRRGCKDPPRATYRLPFGIDILQKVLRADREQQFVPLFIERFQEVGAWTFMDSVLSLRYVIFTCEPQNVQAMLATQFQDFELGRRRAVFRPLLGDGIFTQDGKVWEHSRAMLRPQFAREQISDLLLEERHVKNIMQALPVDVDGWTEQTDLLVLFFRLTIDSATEFLFGQSTNSQLALLPNQEARPGSDSGPPIDEATFAHAFDLSQRWMARRGRFRDLYWMIDSKELRTACGQVHEFVGYYVRLALNHQVKEKDPEKQGDKQKYVFLEALVAETRDPIELRDQLLNILLAGRDSTAAHLGWLFYLLARHPRVFEKLRATVIEHFGTYDEPRNLTFLGLKSCQYLQSCNNETLRVYPVLPINTRQAARDTTLPTGGGPDGKSPIFVHKGQTVLYTVHAMHRRKDLWGEDADEFKPERWEEGLKPGWNFLPFNGGPRICIGRMFPPSPTKFLDVDSTTSVPWSLLTQSSLVILGTAWDGMSRTEKGRTTESTTLTWKIV